MARTAGRSTPFALFVGVLCAAIVAGLVFLALPMFPGTAAWAESFFVTIGHFFRTVTGG